MRKDVIVAVGLLILLAAAVGVTLRDYSEQHRPTKSDEYKQIELTSEEITYTLSETETETTTETTSNVTAETTQGASEQTETKRTTNDTTDNTTTNTAPSLSSKIAFFYDDGEPVYVTHEEYYQICGVVMNETGYGSYEGCIAVAQCIRNQIIREKRKGNPYDIASIRALYGEHYTRTPNDRVRRAVTDVFYNHIVVTTEPIIAWCNGGSSWHNQQIAVCSYDGNTFYKLKVKDF